MSILVNVINQKMVMSSCNNELVAGSQQFVKFRFNLDEDWKDLVSFAQFRQGENAYNQYLDEDNCAYLPPEIGVGTCTLMLYGSNNATIGTCEISKIADYSHRSLRSFRIIRKYLSHHVVETGCDTGVRILPVRKKGSGF